MKEWFSAAELAAMALPDLPVTPQGINRLAARDCWQYQDRTGRGGGREYHLDALPPAARAAILLKATPKPANDKAEAAEARRDSLWSVFDRKPQSIKDEAMRRLQAVQAVEALMEKGLGKLAAINAVAANTKEATGTLRRWMDSLKDVERHDRLAALAPKWCGRTATADIPAEAWDLFKADFLRPERPRAAACYERLTRIAQAEGWTLPALSTFTRRLQKQLSPTAITLARKGAEAAARMYPAQERDHAVFHALQAVNADGHKFDVFVKWPDGRIGRPIMVAWQDIYSGKLLAYRVGETESAAQVRLSLADLVHRWGVPDQCWLDNGRGFASKWITGGTATRFRFKVKEEDPSGVLTMLGVKVHWATPYHGQAKPIERAFRDLAEYVAKAPEFAGAYVGNKPDAKPENYGSRAIPFADFMVVLAREIDAHNARPGRLSPVCAGRSFDETFNASYREALIRRASADQRRQMLLAAEGVTASREDGSIRLAGNRYWSDAAALRRAAGAKVVVRFDPDDLSQAVHVYGLDGGYLCEAALVEKAGFDDIAQARAHTRARKDFIRAQRQVLDAEVRLNVADLATRMPAQQPAPAPDAPQVLRPLFGRGGTALAAQQVQQPEDEVMSLEERQTRRAAGIARLRAAQEFGG